MAVQRDSPYGAFNFRVTCNRFGDPGGVSAGFEEVTGLALDITVHEYRSGNERAGEVRKMPGLAKVGDVTLKRGVTGNLDLFHWIRDVANGAPNARSNVTIELLDEARQQPIMAWHLRNAFPVRYEGPTLNATDSGSVAIETLVLACEGMEVE